MTDPLSWWLERYDDLPMIASRDVIMPALIAQTIVAVNTPGGKKVPPLERFVPEWASTKPTLPPVLEEDLRFAAELRVLPQELYDDVRALVD